MHRTAPIYLLLSRPCLACTLCVLSLVFPTAVLPTAVLPTTLFAREPILLEHRWEVEPPLEPNWIVVSPEVTTTLDVQRLTSPLKQIRVAEAQNVVLLSEKKLLAGQEPAREAIYQALEAGEENRQALLALVSAAISLSDASHAERLWQLSRNHDEARHVVERALVRWKSPAALELWRERLAGDPPVRELLTALEGLAVVGDGSERAALERLLQSDGLAEPLKVAAASTLGQLVDSGLEDLATQIRQQNLPQRDLIAAHLLDRHATPEAKKIVLDILAGKNHPAQVKSYATLVTIDPESARQQAESLMKHPDNSMRHQVVQVLNRLDDEASLRLQAELMQDVNFDIRCTVRENLAQKAQLASLQPIVDSVIDYYLTSDSYRGCEQAILLATALGQQERCPQLVALLEHPQPEVNMRAAWALQEMVEDPALLSAMLEHASEITQQLVDGEKVATTDVLRLAYILEAFGRTRYEPSIEMLRLYVPKDGQRMHAFSRTSAIWALGKLFEGSQDAQLAKQLAERLLDDNPIEPEEDIVKYASAIALGWIGNPTSPAELQKSPETPPFPVGLATEWALQQFESNATR